MGMKWEIFGLTYSLLGVHRYEDLLLWRSTFLHLKGKPLSVVKNFWQHCGKLHMKLLFQCFHLDLGLQVQFYPFKAFLKMWHLEKNGWHWKESPKGINLHNLQTTKKLISNNCTCSIAILCHELIFPKFIVYHSTNLSRIGQWDPTGC